MTTPGVSAAEADVPLFLVGTRFQAMMALAVIRHLDFGAYDLVVYLQKHQSLHTSDLAFSALIGSARQVHYIDRGVPKLRLIWAQNQAVGPGRRTVLTAAISNPFVLALFRVRPGLRLQTFDEGSYNVASTGPFLAPTPRRLRAPRDLLAWALFPKGPLAFARARSERHYTAFTPERNFMSERAVRVHVPWEEVALPEEVAQVCDARHIMVLPCMEDFRGTEPARKCLMSLARGCDLVVRHPRDPVLPDVSSVGLKSPIEGVACALAERAPLTVLHYGSTVGLTLEGRTQINLVDLSKTLLADLEVPAA
jgi:hypothetical protein